MIASPALAMRQFITRLALSALNSDDPVPKSAFQQQDLQCH